MSENETRQDMRIVNWLPNQSPQLKQDFETIFFLCTSRKTFIDEADRESFLTRWTEYYFAQCPDEIFFALDDRGRTLGYLTGCHNSQRASAMISQRLPSYLAFADQFANFPAHLHLNCHPDAQGKGVGSALVAHYCDYLVSKSVGGVHIVTSPEARNVNFYHKLGFTQTLRQKWREFDLFFMGKKLEGITN